MTWLYVVGSYEGVARAAKGNRVLLVYVSPSESRACEVCAAINAGNHEDQPALVLRLSVFEVGDTVDVDKVLAAYGVPVEAEQTLPRCWPDQEAAAMAKRIAEGYEAAAKLERSTETPGRKAVTGTLTATNAGPCQFPTVDPGSQLGAWLGRVCEPGTKDRALAEALAELPQPVREALLKSLHICLNFVAI